MHPAQRIASALEKISAGPNIALVDSWAAYFSVEPKSPQLGLGMLSLLQELEEVQLEIAASNLSDKAKSLYNSAAGHLAQFVSPFTVGQVSVASLKQASEKIDLLHLAGDALPARLVPKLEHPTKKALVGELFELRESAASAEMDAELRRMVLTSIDALLMIVQNYETLGPLGAARIFGSVATGLMRANQDAAPAKGKAKTVLTQLFSAVKKIGAVVIFAGAVVGGAHEAITDGSDLVGFIADGKVDDGQ